MRPIIFLLLLTATIAAFNATAAATESVSDFAMIVGTSFGSVGQGDPKAARGKYFETVHGGVLLKGAQAGFYLQVKPLKSWRKPLYIKIDYQNPQDADTPLSNEMELPPIKRNALIRQEPLIVFSSPQFISGIRNHHTYRIVVRVFDKRGANTPIDVLQQDIVAYADTTGERVVVSRAAGVKIYPEIWRFDFDDREWALGNQGGADGHFVREYVLKDETVTNWSALITSQHWSESANPLFVMQKMMLKIARDCPSTQMRIIDQSAETVLFEWWHRGAGPHPAQHEIRLITSTNRGTHALAFTEKGLGMEAIRRERWIGLLRAAKLQ